MQAIEPLKPAHSHVAFQIYDPRDAVATMAKAAKLAAKADPTLPPWDGSFYVEPKLDGTQAAAGFAWAQ